MKKYVDVLKKTKLFYGISNEDIYSMLDCLGARVSKYNKGAYVFRCGEYVDDIAVLLQGRLHIQKEDYWGNLSILSRVTACEMFGEAYASSESGIVMNDVVAVEDSVVAFFNVKRILAVCSSACRFHSMVVQNLFYAVSEKNRNLVQKLGHMSRRTTREKLISYLSEEARRNNSGSFTIEFNRQQLADFLSVDRSAMSNELCKMRNEGLLEFKKNNFYLKQHIDDKKIFL